jgi:predicted metal-binding membrane protein
MALAVLAWVAMALHVLAGGHVCCAASPAAEWSAWMAMIVAMMVPTLGDALRDVALRSYRVRRGRAVGLYVAGYLATWALVGMVVAALRQVPAMRAPWAAVAAFSFGAMWTLLPVRARWIAGCHRRIPLAPIGLRADIDALRQGAVNGAPCVAMCWPVMVGCALAGHAPVVMVAGACLTLVEKRMYFPRALPVALGIAALGAWVLLLPGW